MRPMYACTNHDQGLDPHAPTRSRVRAGSRRDATAFVMTASFVTTVHVQTQE